MTPRMRNRIGMILILALFAAPLVTEIGRASCRERVLMPV